MLLYCTEYGILMCLHILDQLVPRRLSDQIGQVRQLLIHSLRSLRIEIVIPKG
jgi:hypothetical protein